MVEWGGSGGGWCWSGFGELRSELWLGGKFRVEGVCWRRLRVLGGSGWRWGLSVFERIWGIERFERERNGGM